MYTNCPRTNRRRRNYPQRSTAVFVRVYAHTMIPQIVVLNEVTTHSVSVLFSFDLHFIVMLMFLSLFCPRHNSRLSLPPEAARLLNVLWNSFTLQCKMTFMILKEEDDEKSTSALLRIHIISSYAEQSVWRSLFEYIGCRSYLVAKLLTLHP